jgi:16S rRNA (adenine1518-N6/adenine1519-N6)-dimethyltransferase
VDVLSILEQHGIRPSKGLGQNFLVDKTVLDRIVQASEVGSQDVVLEVGPGVGILTRQLAERGATVVCVELDRKMIAVLAETLQGCESVHIIQGDILEIDPVDALCRSLGLADAQQLRYQVVANLPYYITSAALRHLLTARVRPQTLTVMVQQEVADRIMAQPGDLSLLAIGVQVFGDPERICKVSARAFYPRPQVDSSVLRVRVLPEPRIPEAELPFFFRVVAAGYGQKRKQLHNSLAHNLALSRDVILDALARAGIAPDRRPQTLSIEAWGALARALATRDPRAQESR